MPTNKNPDAEKAAAHAKKAESLALGAPEQAAAYASLAVYYQLKANESGNSTLAAALVRHAGAMEEFDPRLR